MIFLSEKNCVLILANEYDYCSYAIYEILKDEKKNVLLIPERDFVSKTSFKWKFNNSFSGHLQYGSSFLNFSELSGVLMRYVGSWQQSKDVVAEDIVYVASERRAAFLAWLQSLLCPVVNRPLPQTTVGEYPSSFDLFEIINQTGLKTHRTLITNNYQEALDFHKICGNKTIYSPLSVSSKYLLSDDDIEKIKPIIKVLPVSLYDQLEGEKIELFIIGQKILVETSTGKTATLPKNIEEKLIRLNQKLGLVFSKMKFLRRKSDFYFLSVDNYPQYFRCSEELKNKINRELLNLLLQNGGYPI